jgi:membrane associated rhomboid family serine protease
MNKKVHFQTRRGGSSIDSHEDLYYDEEGEEFGSSTGTLSDKREMHVVIPETSSPIHGSRNRSTDNDLSPNLSPGLSRRRQNFDVLAQSDMSLARRRQMLTPEMEDHDNATDFNLADVYEESGKRSSATSVPARVSPGTESETSNVKSWQSTLYSKLFYWTSYWPIFTVTIMFINWVFFIWGIVWIIGWENANVSLTEPISPPQAIFPFITVNDWPSCSSARSNTWRLMTSQFTHSGIQHIGGNTLAGLIYGSLLECTHPFHWLVAILAYEMGCVFGCLGHSYVWPFEGMIGCSTGIYALIGCCISHVVLDGDTLNRGVHYGLIVTLLFQGTYDTVTYFYAYNSDIAYTGHCTAFFTGIFLGASFGLQNKQKWKKVFGMLGLMCLVVLAASLVAHYVQAWPPSSLPYNPTFHSYDRRSCCGELYGVTNGTLSLEQAKQTYACNDGAIYNWHKQ